MPLDGGTRSQKLTFGEMRETGVSRVIVFCSDYRCSHSTRLSANRWTGHLGLSDIEPQFVCQECGKRGADVRPLFEQARVGTGMTAWICDQWLWGRPNAATEWQWLRKEIPAGVLGRFDFVVASIHGRFKLDKKEQTARLLRAISNPRTTILGHSCAVRATISIWRRYRAPAQATAWL
jgi:hypothetical protein